MRAPLSSAIVVLDDPRSGLVRYTAWVRRNPLSGETIYAASYSDTGLPGHTARFVKVVFPLPNGYAMVLMRPVAHDDGCPAADHDFHIWRRRFMRLHCDVRRYSSASQM